MDREASQDRVNTALSALQSGRSVILTDDVDRENEGDLVVAADKVTPEAIGFMSRHARGLVCVSLDQSVAERLDLPLQTLNNNSLYQTPFAMSVDARGLAEDAVTYRGRCQTIRRLVDPSSGPEDFDCPGHVFPLIAHPAGVFGRNGQTEGSYDLARLAGFTPAAVICEVLGLDGDPLRGAALQAFAKEHMLPSLSVRDVARYRLLSEVHVRKVGEESLDTDFGPFKVEVFHDSADLKEHLLLSRGSIAGVADPLLLRLHSECLTGDVFGSRRCDCGSQLSQAMEMIAREGRGALLYLRQEGRGIGLRNKLRAYALQDLGQDTVEANQALGFPPDQRNFIVAARVLALTGVASVRLLTNNPDKVAGLEAMGIKVVERIAIVAPEDEYTEAYLSTKRSKLGHIL